MMCSVSRLPIAPACSFCRSARKLGSKRRLNPRKSRALPSAPAAERARSTLRSTGFSQKMALPAAAACRQCARCWSVGTGDDDARNGGIGQRTLQRRRGRAVPGRQHCGGVPEGVDDVLQRQCGMRRRIGRMNLADPAAADQRDGGGESSLDVMFMSFPRRPGRAGRRCRGRRSATCGCCGRRSRSRESGRGTSTPTASGSRGSPPPVPAGRYRLPWRSRLTSLSVMARMAALCACAVLTTSIVSSAYGPVARRR